MSDQPVSLHRSGPPETVLDEEASEALAALDAALASDDAEGAIGKVCEQWPMFLAAWVALGDTVTRPSLKYACYRTAYHRGLDRLRGSGWRGSGYVRWRHEANRGFLRALDGLRATAETIGEVEEAQRCAVFLHQLDPEWPPE